MLCSLCQKVRYPHAYWTKAKTWKRRHDACLFRHYATYQELIDSAKNGCELCNLFQPFVEYAQNKASGSIERADSDASSSEGDGRSQDDPFEWFGETEELKDGSTLLHNVPEIRISLTDGIFYEDEGDKYRWLTDRSDEKYWHYWNHVTALLEKEEEEDIAAGLLPDPNHQHKSDKNEVLQWLFQDQTNYTGPEQLWVTAWTFVGDNEFSYMGHLEVTTVVSLSAGSIDDRHPEQEGAFCLDGQEIFADKKALALRLPWLWKWPTKRLWIRRKKPHHNLKPHFEFFQFRGDQNAFHLFNRPF